MFGFAEEHVFAAGVTTLAPPEPESIVPRLREFQRPTDVRGDTSTLVTRLWEATETAPLIDDWKPDRLDPVVVSGRTFRWPIIVAAILLAMGGLAVIQALQDMPQRAAAEASASYQSAAADFEAVLPQAEQALAVITDPTADGTALSEASVALSAFNDRARNLFDTAAEPLPATPPLVSRAELDALSPVRTSMANAAEIGLTLERRLGDTLSYRLLYAKAFQLPDLPVSAMQDQITQLGIALGLAATNTGDAVADLPDEPFLSEHKLASLRLSRRLDDWQIEYLDALRTGDAATADSLISEMSQRVGTLTTSLSAPLAAINQWATTQLQTLHAQLSGMN